MKKRTAMGMFQSRKSDLASGPDVPIDQVSTMRAQGYTNNQIIQSLQRDGYTSSQIFDAISQSEMNAKQMPDSRMSPLAQQPNSMQQAEMPPPPQQMAPMSQMPSMPPTFAQTLASNQPSTEEIVEAIIDEKWNELVKDINKVIEWKQRADTKLTAIEQQMNDMKEQFDKLHNAILGKIGDYDKHMMDVGAELQAMEKVFTKILPNFVDNVNELSRITENIKAGNTPSTPAVATPRASKSPTPQSSTVSSARGRRVNLEDIDDNQ